MENHISSLTSTQRSNNLRVLHLFNDGEIEHSDDIHVLPRIQLYPRYNRKVALLLFNVCCIVQILSKKTKEMKVLHTHGDYESLLLIFFFKIIYRFKIVHTFHNDISQDNGLKKYLRRTLISWCDVIINVNLLSHNFVGKKSIFFPSPLPERNKFRIVSRPTIKRVVCVSNVFPVKNLSMLKKVAETNREIQFDHFGAGDMSAILTNNIKSFGVISRLELISKLVDYDLLIHFAHYEGTPSAMIEAASIGLPILGPRVSGLHELFPSCVFVNPNCAECYSAALRELNDYSVRVKISKTLWSQWSGYNWDDTYDLKLSFVFNDLLSKRL